MLTEKVNMYKSNHLTEWLVQKVFLHSLIPTVKKKLFEIRTFNDSNRKKSLIGTWSLNMDPLCNSGTKGAFLGKREVYWKGGGGVPARMVGIGGSGGGLRAPSLCRR